MVVLISVAVTRAKNDKLFGCLSLALARLAASNRETSVSGTFYSAKLWIYWIFLCNSSLRFCGIFCFHKKCFGTFELFNWDESKFGIKKLSKSKLFVEWNYLPTWELRRLKWRFKFLSSNLVNLHHPSFCSFAFDRYWSWESRNFEIQKSFSLLKLWFEKRLKIKFLSINFRSTSTWSVLPHRKFNAQNLQLLLSKVSRWSFWLAFLGVQRNSKSSS